MDKKLISVVIPCYNRRDKLPACLFSVLGQTYTNMEVIVVDDASTDGTQELFENITDPRVKYYRYEQNRGACYARNYGAERARGELLAFQDSDDTWRAEKLEKQLRLHHFHGEKALEEFLAENRAGTQTMLMKKGVWEALRFDESFRRYQDWDFAIRAAEHFTLCYLPEALADSEVGGDSISFAVKSYPALVHLYEKHRALYEKYPQSDAVMNRRMGKRLHKTDPGQAAKHYWISFKLSHKWYDLAYYLGDRARALRSGRKKEDKEI